MKRVKTEPAGWAPARPGGAVYQKVIAERDINQIKNRKAGLGNTWSKGSTPRQLGLAYLGMPKNRVYFLYTHSQISNRYGFEPAAYIGLTVKDLEWVVTEGLRELARIKEEE